ncbi:MAG: hypothetical protein AAGA70_07325 [Pseudomonadota bacterium]
MRTFSLLCVPLVALTACSRGAEPAQLLSIEDGVYVAVIDAACATLEFGRRDRASYAFDSNCDGVAEVSTSEVSIIEAVISAGPAQVVVTAVGTNSFSGQWRQGESQADVRFARQGG